MSKSLGREAIRKTLKNLKSTLTLDLKFFNESRKDLHKSLSEVINVIDKDQKWSYEAQFLIQRLTTELAANTTIIFRSFLNYVYALEAYTAELDSTFDDLLKAAEKKAKEEATKQPKGIYT